VHAMFLSSNSVSGNCACYVYKFYVCVVLRVSLSNYLVSCLDGRNYVGVVDPSQEFFLHCFSFYMIYNLSLFEGKHTGASIHRVYTRLSCSFETRDRTRVQQQTFTWSRYHTR
jgi:hypothetical protein